MNEHADLLDNMPTPAILPREQSDEQTAQVLSEIVPVILDRAGYDEVYDLIHKTDKGLSFVEVTDDILAGVPQNDWVKTVKKNLKQKFPNGILIGNNEIKIDQQSRREMTYSGYTKWLRANDSKTYEDKLRSTNNADEILLATDNWVDEGLNHQRKDKIASFARGQVLLRMGENDYAADVIVGTEQNGGMKLYDVVNIQPTAFTKKETDTAKAANPSPGASRNTVPFSNNNISQTGTEGNGNNTQNSDQKSVGRSIDELRTQGEQMTPEERKAYVEASRARRAKLCELAERYGEIPAGETTGKPRNTAETQGQAGVPDDSGRSHQVRHRAIPLQAGRRMPGKRRPRQA